ncbi:MAG: type II secretion system F family protein [marine benthic group bacterium]|jgi:tight adherence protein C|nr:type II secretion system F family protein [Gemmatimonadota bacterium]
MMIILVVILSGLAVMFMVVAAAEFVPARDRNITRKLSELEEIASSRTVAQKRRRQTKREQLEVWLETLGERVAEGRDDVGEIRLKLLQAGYRSPRAVSIYYSIRVLSVIAAAVLIIFLAPAMGLSGNRLLIWIGAAAAAGWILPSGILSRKVRLRQKELQKALPDTLDMLVVCVEAGLGLNQAIVRVSDEVEHISAAMSEELQIVNLEIRAGTPREDALRHLGERTGLKDIQGLVAMLIQTDRFGTSIAQALRVHSDDLRVKRRQRAEEQAAKTTIKLVIPLAIFVFPAMFVVILGPAVLSIMESFSSL